MTNNTNYLTEYKIKLQEILPQWINKAHTEKGLQDLSDVCGHHINVLEVSEAPKNSKPYLLLSEMEKAISEAQRSNCITNVNERLTEITEKYFSK